MIVSIYLERYAIDVMECYGTINDVVNRMLDAADGDTCDVFDKPSAGPRTIDSVRVDIDVTNDDYLQLMDTFPSNSPRISLRRYIHWFIDNEMPQFLGWEVVNEYRKKEKDKIKHLLSKAEASVKRAGTHLVQLGEFECEAIMQNILKEISLVRKQL